MLTYSIKVEQTPAFPPQGTPPFAHLPQEINLESNRLKCQITTKHRTIANFVGV